MATKEETIDSSESTDFDTEVLQKSILEIPSIVEKQDKIVESLDKFSGVLDGLSKRIDEIEKSKSKKQEDDDDDKVQINIEDDDEDKEKAKKKKKSDDLEARIKAVEEEISKKAEVKKEEEEAPKAEEPPKVEEPAAKVEKSDTVEPTAPPAASRPIQKEDPNFSYLKAAADELNKFGSWKAIATEKMNQNRIVKMEEELAMTRGMEETRQKLESISVQTQAAPVRELKRGGFLN